jgi:hypothetical protein
MLRIVYVKIKSMWKLKQKLIVFKLRWVETSINRSILMNCLACKCPFQGTQWTRSREEHKRFQRL